MCVATLGEVFYFLKLRRSDFSFGYASGVFDLFHYGHVNYLRECRSLCDVLIVGVDSDERVRYYKGAGRPINPESERMANVAKEVDYCFRKVESSVFYSKILLPDYHFFPDNKLLSLCRISELSSLPNFKGIYHVEYTKGISTTAIIDSEKW